MIGTVSSFKPPTAQITLFFLAFFFIFCFPRHLFTTFVSYISVKNGRFDDANKHPQIKVVKVGADSILQTVI